MAGKQHKERKAVKASETETENVPAIISDNAEKMELWTFLVEDLKNRGQYSSTYTFVLTDTVNTAWMLHEEETALLEEGNIIDSYNAKGEHIGTKGNPRFDQVMKLKDRLMKCVEKLGMSPRDITFLIPGEVTPEQATQAPQGSERPRIVYFRD